MILVDTGVWIDHLRRGDRLLSGAPVRRRTRSSMGHRRARARQLQRRADTLQLIGQLPQATVATPAETLEFIERHELAGVGVGYVDAQLLAASRLTDNARIWTRDRRLREAAERAGVPSTTVGRTDPQRHPALRRSSSERSYRSGRVLYPTSRGHRRVRERS